MGDSPRLTFSMLQFFQSNDMSALTNAFCERSKSIQIDPFAPLTVIVQSFGTGQWLKLQLALKQGISANLNYVLPANFIWELYRNLLEQTEHSPFDKELLSWRLMALLPGQTSPEFDAVNRYLDAPGDPDLRIYQLANKIADLYNQYLLYRPDWILAWENGEDLVNNNKHPWQAILWRNLLEATPEFATQHRARLHERSLNKLSQMTEPSTLPPHLSVFGLSSIPPMQLETLRALSCHINVDIYFLNPCQHYWGDIVSERGIARRSIRQLVNKSGALEEEDYLEVGNPLLASLGRQGRDFLEMILEAGDINTLDFFDEKSVTSALSYLQNDIFNLEFGGQFGSDQAIIKLKLDTQDRSIQIHSCHSKLREIEILYDQILATIAGNPHINPGDIIVMAPKVTDYAPFINSVFKDHIHYGIADRSLSDESPLINCFVKLLELPESRLSSIEVMDLLEFPAIARKFSLDDEDLNTIAYWIRESGIRWETDGESKARNWQIPANNQNTWQFGLDRLLLGLALTPDGGIVNETLPFEVDLGDTELLGTLCEIFGLLKYYRSELEKPRSAQNWQITINSLLSDFFETEDRETLDISTIQLLTQKLTEHTENADHKVDISGHLLRYWINLQLADSGSSISFISGGITFATLVPMRSVPFKMVCLLGMNDKEYPRENRDISFNLMLDQAGRKGDRSRRIDDRYLFLEAILSARDVLYVSFEGRSLKDNQVKPPSVVVSELMEYNEAVFETIELIEHPLQPFSRRYYFTRDVGTELAKADTNKNRNDDRPGLVTFQRSWYDALDSPIEVGPFLDSDLAPADENELNSIGQLVDFLTHSGRYFLQKRLGIYFTTDENELLETESFTLDGLERYQLSDAALKALIKKQDIRDWHREMIASGFVMEGPIGASYLEAEVKHAQLIYGELETYLEESMENYHGTITVSGIELEGHLRNLTAEHILSYRSGKLRRRHLIENWLNHLFASASGLNTDLLSISRGKNSADISRLLALSQDQAMAHLENVVNLYKEGLKSPLFLPPETSFSFVLSMDAKDDFDLAQRAAVKAWNGNEFSESQDVYWRRLFDVRDVMDEGFYENAGIVYGPLLLNMEVISS